MVPCASGSDTGDGNTQDSKFLDLGSSRVPSEAQLTKINR